MKDSMTVKELIVNLKKIEKSGFGDYAVIHSYNIITNVQLDHSDKIVVLTGLEKQ